MRGFVLDIYRNPKYSQHRCALAGHDEVAVVGVFDTTGVKPEFTPVRGNQLPDSLPACVLVKQEVRLGRPRGQGDISWFIAPFGDPMVTTGRWANGGAYAAGGPSAVAELTGDDGRRALPVHDYDLHLEKHLG